MRAALITLTALLLAGYFYIVDPHVMVGSTATDLAILRVGAFLFSPPVLLLALAGAVAISYSRWAARRR